MQFQKSFENKALQNLTNCKKFHAIVNAMKYSEETLIAEKNNKFLFL